MDENKPFLIVDLTPEQMQRVIMERGVTFRDPSGRQATYHANVVDIEVPLDPNNIPRGEYRCTGARIVNGERVPVAPYTVNIR